MSKEVDFNCSLLAFNFNPLALVVSHSAMKLASCSISFSPHMIMSSAIPIVFGTSARTLSSLSWNMSEVILRPNGSLSHLNLPYSVLNVD